MTHTVARRAFVPSVPVAKGMLSMALSMLGLWYDRHCERRHLAEMPADRLIDIGVTREAARKEASKYFWEV